MVFLPIFTPELKQGKSAADRECEGTVKKSLIISFFLYGKQSKTSPVSTGDFSFPVTGTHISLTATYILPLMQNSSFVNRFHPVHDVLRRSSYSSLATCSIPLSNIHSAFRMISRRYRYRHTDYCRHILACIYTTSAANKSVTIQGVIKVL